MQIDQKIVPDEVEDAFRKAWLDGSLSVKGAIAAALAAWPGVHQHAFSDNRGMFTALILPLTDKT